MAEIELSIGGRPYVLKSEESREHMLEVAELVRRKIDSLKKTRPSLTLQQAAILAAFDFASMAISGKKKGSAYRAQMLGQATDILKRVEAELSDRPPIN